MTEEESIEREAEIGVEENAPENFFIDILTGNKESASAKKLLVKKVLRQLIEGYGFSRSDLETDYKPRIQGHGGKRIDIAIFQPDTEHTNDKLQRIIICGSQRNRDILCTYAEAEADIQSLQDLMELFPLVSLGMWTNGQEEFMVRVEQNRFETKLKPIGIWPALAESRMVRNSSSMKKWLNAYGMATVLKSGVPFDATDAFMMNCHWLLRNIKSFVRLAR